jgi:hypothetical protein
VAKATSAVVEGGGDRAKRPNSHSSRADAIDRYYLKQLIEKYKWTPSQITDFLEGRSHTHSDRGDQSE